MEKEENNNNNNFSNLINKINILISDFKNILTEADLQFLIKSRKMFMKVGNFNIIKTQFGEHFEFCKSCYDNTETCACFYFVIQQHNVNQLCTSYKLHVNMK
jgi:hypothetical protein